MTHALKLRICYLRDTLGSTYLGFKILPYAIQDILDHWFENFESLVDSDFKTFYETRERRDGTSFHTTLLNVAEFNKEGIKQSTQDLIGREYKLTIKGVGRAYDSVKNIEAHFIVLECPHLDRLRESLGLEKRDLHITIGFHGKDVFTKPKDQSSIYLPWVASTEVT